MTYLIIDDNYVDRLIIRTMIQKTDSNGVIVESSGVEQGIDWLKSLDVKTQHEILIFLDIKMPIYDGFEFVDMYQSLPEEIKSKSRIIMVSSTLDPKDISRAEDSPYVERLIEKPMSVEKLEEIKSVKISA